MKRRWALLAVPLLAVATAAVAAVGLPTSSPPLKAKVGPVAMFEAGEPLLAHPRRTLQTLRSLGVRVVRLNVQWASIAPDSASPNAPTQFNGSDPEAYPPGNWARFDTVVRQASADGIALDFLLTGGAPLWANGPGAPPSQRSAGSWDPSASAYGQFVQAVGTRYSGTYTPPGASVALPRVHFWEIWSEPNWGPSLQPQLELGPVRIDAAREYRLLLDSAWSALHRTGHGGDTVVIGSLSPRGIIVPPNSALAAAVAVSGPLAFTRTLYCVDSADRPLRGQTAALVGCPTTDSGSGRFRREHPALFAASGYGIHPYPIGSPPTEADASNPDTVEFSQIPQLASLLDRLVGIYGLDTQLPIYNTEFGYITNPPNPGTEYPSPATAARYLNWTEYLTWRNPRIASTMQFLLYDGNPLAAHAVGFSTGLLFSDGKPKATFNAYRMPIFLPGTKAGPNQALEVWGDVRPARYAYLDTHRPQSVDIQFRTGASGPFRTLKTIGIGDVHGYFDVAVRFPASGTVRLRWSYPSDDRRLREVVTPEHTTIYSRPVFVTVRWWQAIPSNARLTQRFTSTR